ncbi:MAG: hypothetical protein GY801_53275 [bacterium]|nr:hypothetical protein [bacterium]
MPRIIHNRLHAPFFIFIKCGDGYSDQELLSKIGAVGYSSCINENEFDVKIHIANYNEWAYIADDWYYTLWHAEDTKKNVEKIAQEYDVYTCMIGDSDNSLELYYYKDGTLKRKYVFSQYYDFEGEVKEDYGLPLKNEEAALKEYDVLEAALKIAEPLGIETNFSKLQIRTYSKRKEKLCSP